MSILLGQLTAASSAAASAAAMADGCSLKRSTLCTRETRTRSDRHTLITLIDRLLVGWLGAVQCQRTTHRFDYRRGAISVLSSFAVSACSQILCLRCARLFRLRPRIGRMLRILLNAPKGCCVYQNTRETREICCIRCVCI